MFIIIHKQIFNPYCPSPLLLYNLYVFQGFNHKLIHRLIQGFDAPRQVRDVSLAPHPAPAYVLGLPPEGPVKVSPATIHLVHIVSEVVNVQFEVAPEVHVQQRLVILGRQSVGGWRERVVHEVLVLALIGQRFLSFPFYEF